MAVISIRLEGMTDVPGRMAYNHLYSWLHGNVLHVEMDFNLDDVPHNDFEMRLNTMLSSFEKGGAYEEYINFVSLFSDTVLIFLFLLDGRNFLSSSQPIQSPAMVTCTLGQTMLELCLRSRSVFLYLFILNF